jgi:hypothetical protein
MPPLNAHRMVTSCGNHANRPGLHHVVTHGVKRAVNSSFHSSLVEVKNQLILRYLTASCPPCGKSVRFLG